MRNAIKKEWSEAELTEFLNEQPSNRLLEEYVQYRIEFEDNVLAKRYSVHNERMTEALKKILLQRLGCTKLGAY